MGMRAGPAHAHCALFSSVAADVDATLDMLRQLKKAAPRLRLTFGCSTFVPKSHTPFMASAGAVGLGIPGMAGAVQPLC